MPDVVRVDQYYTAPEVVDAYHETRRAYFKGAAGGAKRYLRPAVTSA